jgi:hypothetical protein
MMSWPSVHLYSIEVFIQNIHLLLLFFLLLFVVLLLLMLMLVGVSVWTGCS